MDTRFASADLTAGQLNAIVKKLGGHESALKFLRGELVVLEPASKPEAAMPEIFHLTVDYGKSLAEMIAPGHYDWTNGDITAKRFPVSGEGLIEFEARYFHFDRNISSEDAIKEIESEDTENPWIPAKIEHTLSHGATFPEEQRKFPIIGLGSVALVFGGRHVPYLSLGGAERRLRLIWFGGVWGPFCRFLAVRKVSVPQS